MIFFLFIFKVTLFIFIFQINDYIIYLKKSPQFNKKYLKKIIVKYRLITWLTEYNTR